jgi:hypothetical protein
MTDRNCNASGGIMKLFLATALVAFIVVGFPVWVVACMCKLYGSKSRGRGIVAVGNALQELDRLVARPSIVHKVDLETKVLDMHHDHGGE